MCYHRLPFDWKTFPYGYFSAAIIEALLLVVQFHVASFLLCFIFGAIKYFKAIIQDIKLELNTLNNNWKVNHNREELTKDLGAVIHIHTAAKE